MNAKTIRNAIERNLLQLPGVVGITHTSSITIYVESEEYVEAMPKWLANIPVTVKVIGKIYAIQMLQQGEEIEEIDRTGVVRPLVGGISVSNDKCYCAGTLGIAFKAVVIRLLTNLALSNAHVFAMDDKFSFVEQATIFQPGMGDGGTEEHRIGELLAYWLIEFGPYGENHLDAAIAIVEEEFIEDAVLAEDNISTYLIDLTPTEVEIGDPIRKSGRTTEITYGMVDSIDATIKVLYGQKYAIFKDIVAVKSENTFVLGGDSGSLADKDGGFVGLCFAANEDGTWGFICKAKYLTEPIPAPEPSLGGISLLVGAFCLLAAYAKQ